MLTSLRIEHLAIIERCEVEFEPGLNILTGETGAGKSIIVGALGLVLGDRASSEDVRAGCSTARVEAVFEAVAQFRKNATQTDDETIVVIDRV